MTAATKTKFDTAYMVNIIKFAFVTAVGYTAWQVYTTHRKHDWTNNWSYVELFLVVFTALVVANFAFTLLFQRDKLWPPVVQHQQALAVNTQTHEADLLDIYSK